MEATATADGTASLSYGDKIRNLEQGILKIQSELAIIALQLGDPERRASSASGEPWTQDEYRRWRRTALSAKAIKERELRALKDRRRNLLREGRDRLAAGGDELAVHTLRLLKILIELSKDGVLEQDEIDAMDDVKVYFRRVYGDNAFGGSGSVEAPRQRGG